ncbi:DNA cytosine methyltransferase [Paenibacillus sp. V4I5]|uniref:DNA cytosine methyltransferase n=1 Tax=Paenibacillus sp. V4I5 TaxID=3042306 RepID=UPI002791BB37|nr:DNA (cytosine-5-)-methyltransferase [Paenibacillus sp. V4I5]MDQ0919160.1 DNA (cytosine-5)-methyltransferase 1 [Paenibacillus sp. V4I5]
MRFIDLFAGLGGFHLALNSLGHTCVFASELDPKLRELYYENFKIRPRGDIRDIGAATIPEHDILCGGFPCQPFSKAGEQNGFEDEKSGDLFHHILKVLKHHNPKYLILENVPNFAKHDEGRTWRIAEKLLRDLEYDVQLKKLSPHRFGIPQIRERVFIVGKKKGLDGFIWPDEKWPDLLVDENEITINKVLDPNPTDARQVSDQVVRCIEVWQNFLNHFPKERQLPSFPIWSMEFGATYPYEEITPWKLGAVELRKYLGSHGKSLDGLTDEEVFQSLPSYARTEQDKFPDWKIRFIKQNRALYAENLEWMNSWLPEILPFPSSFQKFEWNCKGAERDLRKLVLQCRASGLRAKRPTTAPSLVAMTATQVPIISWENRYMTPRECARLQSMDELRHLPFAPTAAYQALGNAVNVEVVSLIAKALLEGAVNNRKNEKEPTLSAI